MKHNYAGLLFTWLFTWAFLLAVLVLGARSATADMWKVNANAFYAYPPAFTGTERTMVCETNAVPITWRTDGENIFMDGPMLSPASGIGVYEITVGKNPLSLVFFVSFIDLITDDETRIAIDFELGIVETLDMYDKVVNTFSCK